MGQTFELKRCEKCGGELGKIILKPGKYYLDENQDDYNVTPGSNVDGLLCKNCRSLFTKLELESEDHSSDVWCKVSPMDEKVGTKRCRACGGNLEKYKFPPGNYKTLGEAIPRFGRVREKDNEMGWRCQGCGKLETIFTDGPKKEWVRVILVSETIEETKKSLYSILFIITSKVLKFVAQLLRKAIKKFWNIISRTFVNLELRTDIPKKTYNLLAITTFLVFTGIWCVLSYGKIVDEFFLPTPTKVWNTTLWLLLEKNFLTDIVWSAGRIFGGFAIAAAIAIPLGILMGSFKKIEACISPFCSFIRYMPATAFVPLMILWLGVGETQKLAVIFLGVFFYLLVLIVDTVAHAEMALIETAYTLGASKRQVLSKVILPASWPGILESLKAMVGAAWTYLIVAELVAAERGIGYVIITSQRVLNTAAVLTGIVTVGVIGIITNMVFEMLYAVLFPWKKKVRAAE